LCGEERYWAGDTTGRDPGTELDELRRACARVLGADPETWPSHGNAPLAISAGFALAHRERGDARQRIAELEAENTSLRQPVVSYDEQGESIGVKLAMTRLRTNSLRHYPWPDWVIVGGESGPHARPCDIAWIRDVVRQCRAAGVPVFVKQLGSRPVIGDFPGKRLYHLRDRHGGNMAEWPEDIRVREFPGGSQNA
jgi:hypothetical protein